MIDCLVKSPQEGSVKASQQLEDLELTRRSHAGDADAFEELVTKYRTRIFTIVFSMVLNEHDAREIAQEVFLRAWQSIHRYEGRSSFYRCLCRITVNLTIYSLRRKGHPKEIELNDPILSPLPGLGVTYRCAEILEQVTAALANLSPEDRVIVILKELEDQPYHEIAEILDLSVVTVMSRLCYARKKLQSMLRPVYKPQLAPGPASI